MDLNTLGSRIVDKLIPHDITGDNKELVDSYWQKIVRSVAESLRELDGFGVRPGELLVARGRKQYAEWKILSELTVGSGVLRVPNGGTGIGAYTAGDILCASGTSTLSKITAVESGKLFVSSGAGKVPAWNTLTSLTAASGVLPVANGGTATSTQFTAGSVIFAGANGVYSQNNTDLIWDNSGKKLTAAVLETGSLKITGNESEFDLDVTGAVKVTGTLQVTSTKNFEISHPLLSKKETHTLVHASVESPRADLIYRGVATLENGAVIINIDTVSHMTEGTFKALCRDVQSFVTNTTGWTPVRSSIAGNILVIESKDFYCTDEVAWLVIGERRDEAMYASPKTDDDGRLIVEPEITK